jgi:alpha-galactosidase
VASDEEHKDEGSSTKRSDARSYATSYSTETPAAATTCRSLDGPGVGSTAPRLPTQGRSVARLRRLLVPALACLAVGIGAYAIDAAAAAGGAGAPSVLTEIPYMGWNTYYGVGGVFDQQTIISVARSLINRGLARAGYRIVWLDFGWASGKRDRGGKLLVSGRQWPNGLPWLTGWLHARGLLAGIYTDAGRAGCYHRGVGSLGHYRQDANTFAAWGFDAVKVDFCGAGQEGRPPRPLYGRFAEALRENSSHRPMILNVCNFWVPGQINGKRPSYRNSSYANASWAARIAQSWRTDTDIGATGSIKFQNVLRNLDRDAARPQAAGPGHWNDPDYLGPQLGMSRAQAQAQMTMWAIVAAPLILGSDPRKLSPATIRMLENWQVIAVDQDPLGVQGTAIREERSGQVWVKALVGGARAVALLNRGAAAAEITTTARAVGIARAAHYQLENVWTNTATTTSGKITARVPPHAAVLYRVAAL